VEKIENSTEIFYINFEAIIANYLKEHDSFVLDDEASRLYREELTEEIESWINMKPKGKELW